MNAISDVTSAVVPPAPVPELVTEAEVTPDAEASIGAAMPSGSVSWSEVAAASAEAQTADEEVDYVEEKLLVELSQAEVTAREIANGDRLAERTRLETELETKKAEAKAIKTEIDEVQAEIDEGIKETSSRRALVTKRWRVVSDFRTNTERWYDPSDGRLVNERAIPANRKQMPLPFASSAGSDVSADDAPASEDISFDDSEDEDDHVDPVATDDCAVNLTDDPGLSDPDTEIDATEILEAAPNLLDETPSEPTAKRTRKGRK